MAVPRSVVEFFGALIVHLERLRRVLGLRVLPLGLKLFRERASDFFTVFALLTELLRTPCLTRVVVASAPAALIFDLTEGSLGFAAHTDDFSEPDFGALIGRLVLRPEVSLVGDVDAKNE